MKTFSETKMPFGKYRGISIALINTGYLSWLLGQDWFLEAYDDLASNIEKELVWRDQWNLHFYKDKVKPYGGNQ